LHTRRPRMADRNQSENWKKTFRQLQKTQGLPFSTLLTWQRPKFDSQRFDRAAWKALPKEMQIRELRFHVTQPGFRPADITIATTLLDPIAYPAADLAGLYRERWH